MGKIGRVTCVEEGRGNVCDSERMLDWDFVVSKVYVYTKLHT